MIVVESHRRVPRRVVVSAYACEPEKGSEPGVGWNWVCQIGKRCEVWVITRNSNRATIEAALANTPMPNVHFVYFDFPRWASFWKRGRRGVQSYYYLWQLGVFFVARKLHRKIHFDLAHHVTFVKYWVPSFLTFLRIPFLWGPVGGGESAPVRFWFSLSVRGRICEISRAIARELAQFDPFLRLTARRAALALATTRETEARLRGLGCREVLLVPQVALSQDEITFLKGIPPHHGLPFRVVSVGNLFHLKGYHLALRAFAQFHHYFPESEYWLLGDGSERKRLERLARKLGIQQKVVFWGAMPRASVLEKLTHCDVLLHPTLHDSGGWASIEAMAAGRPIICLDLGGTAVQVTVATGFKIPPASVSKVIAKMAQALRSLAEDPSLRVTMGKGAQERVSNYFHWDRKGEDLAEIYERLLHKDISLLPKLQQTPSPLTDQVGIGARE